MDTGAKFADTVRERSHGFSQLLGGVFQKRIASLYTHTDTDTDKDTDTDTDTVAVRRERARRWQWRRVPGRRKGTCGADSACGGGAVVALGPHKLVQQIELHGGAA